MLFNVTKMILRSVSSKNTTLYYVQKSYRQENGKNATKYVERLGNIEQLKARFGEEDPIGEAKKYVAELTKAEKEAQKAIMVACNPSELIRQGEKRCSNGGYLFLQKIYYELGLDYICGKIEKKHRNSYNLNEILSMLLYTRLLYPGSKLSSLEDAGKFLEQPESRIHQVYRALSVLAEESDNIQAEPEAGPQGYRGCLLRPDELLLRVGAGRRACTVRSQQGGAATADSADGPVHGQGRLSPGHVHRAGEHGGDHDAEANGGEAAGEVRPVEDSGMHRRRPVLIREQEEGQCRGPGIHHSTVAEETQEASPGMGAGPHRMACRGGRW